MLTVNARPAEPLSPKQRADLLRSIPVPSPATAVAIIVLLAIAIWAAYGTEVSLNRLAKGVPIFLAFFAELFPPDPGYWLPMLDPIVVTLQMAVMGVIFSAILAFPLGLMAAQNTAPNPVVYQVTRLFLNIVRAVPSLVWAIMLVAALGFGPFAGSLALGISGVGTLGKLYAEAIEAINPRQVEALRATGSTSLPVFTFAVLPQALPLLVSYTLLDFESYIRSATILGIVGAGGIGFEVQAAFSQFQFHRVLTIVIEIILMVTAVDRLSAFVRARLI
jgi:phosphonate transport system permease protein